SAEVHEGWGSGEGVAASMTKAANGCGTAPTPALPRGPGEGDFARKKPSPGSRGRVRVGAVLSGLCSLLGVGCGASAPPPAPLTVRAVEWTPSHADVGPVKAVADRANEIAVFGDRGATLIAAGAVAFTDRSVTRWATAATIPAADGSGAWIVGVDAQGK